MKKSIIMSCMVVLMAFSLMACGTAAKEENVSKGPEGTLSEIIDKIYTEKALELPLATTDIDITDGELLKSYTGISDGSKVKEASVSESMISAQAYSMVLVRVNDTKDTKTVAEEMLAGINPSKWICVTADDIKVAGAGDTILLIMTATSYADMVTAADIVDAYQTVCDGTLDFTLDK
ncbi:MAG: hypothetical protein ACK5JH_13420 [Anaerocolumna sp.]